jgi:CubicO group peptidase (beta-lactamase class C family)
MERLEFEQKIDDLCLKDDIMKRFNGYILIQKREEVLFSKGYGFADCAAGEKFDHDTIFLIGSLTKVFTSVCILMLEMQGLLNTDDCLEKYLPQYHKASKITIGQLLSHTSGIPDYWNRVGISSIDYNDAYDIFRFITDFDLTETPGKTFRYCNSNYLILAILLETITGMSYEAYISRNILSPLNMRRTGVIPDHHRFDRVATGYKTLLPAPKEAAKPENTIIFGNMLGVGCLFSTASDLAKFGTALFAVKLLSPASLEKMLKPNLDGYGFGWFIESNKVWHGGDVAGYSTRLTRYLSDGTMVIMLSNADGKKEAHMGHFSKLVEGCLY